MENKPVILIAWGSCLDDQFYSHGMMLLRSYELAVAAAGGVPLIPLDSACAEEYISLADGLILPGAQRELVKPGTSQEIRRVSSHRRELFHGELFKAFFEAEKPVMGICEGSQKINCCLGGTLDVDLEKSCGVTHWNSAHSISCSKGSVIESLWGSEAFVNSFHNFAIDKPGDGLVITAVSAQGNAEAFEHESRPVFGYQFHPERMRGDEKLPCEGSDGDRIFRHFISICSERKYSING